MRVGSLGLTLSLRADQGFQLWRTSDRQARFRGTGIEEFRPFSWPENHEPPNSRERCTTATGIASHLWAHCLEADIARVSDSVNLSTAYNHVPLA